MILVEGLFDYTALWEAGFHNVTFSLLKMGTDWPVGLCSPRRRN